jgi:hypothetical protein
LSHPLPFHPLLGADHTKRDPPVRPIAQQRGKFTVSAPNPSIAWKPAWMLGFALEIYRQLENRPDGKFPPAIQRNVFTVTFTVRLKDIPAIDLDRSRPTFVR